MTTLKKPKKPIWFKLEDRHVNSIDQVANNRVIHLCEAIKAKSGLTDPADSLTLQIKRESDNQYTITLDDAYFQEHCGNSFKKLMTDFGIKHSNPIKVTRPGMSLFPFRLLFIFL